ncbi:MAG TPA: hypothetical protein VM328_07815 [Fimbriimonadaceae bacterium]|nr:hypothetical protein [Fimbriimonadaceae bacterium]
MKTPRVLFAAALAAVTAVAQAQGGLFVTGHDPDFHAQAGNTTGARNLINRALDFVTDGIGNNSNAVGNILLVTHRFASGPGGHLDPLAGMLASGPYSITMADDGSAGGGVLNLATVNFSLFDAVVVASDFGGWLTQGELNILNARSMDIINYINGGGGVVAFAESGLGAHLTTSGHWGWLPFLVSGHAHDQVEAGFTVTPFGLSLGITPADVNGNFSHNYFLTTGGMNVIDYDGSGRVMSLAFYGRIGQAGVVPGPGAAIVFLLGMRSLRRRPRA